MRGFPWGGEDGGPALGGKGRVWSSAGGVPGSGTGLREAVGVGTGLDDVAAEGEAVHDCRAESGVGEGLGPANRGWHMFGLSNLGWYLGCLLPGVSADL